MLLFVASNITVSCLCTVKLNKNYYVPLVFIVVHQFTNTIGFFPLKSATLKSPVILNNIRGKIIGKKKK